jgi:hypothetical protein
VLVWPLSARSRTSTSALHASACASKAAPGQAAPLHLGGRRCASTALRFSVAWPVAKLTALTSFAAFRQTATSQLWMRAARAATRPAMLGASEALRSLPGRAFAGTVACFQRTATPVAFAAGAARRGRFGWRRAGEPGRKQSSGLFLPGERPGLWPGAACTGQGRGRRARSARFVI